MKTTLKYILFYLGISILFLNFPTHIYQKLFFAGILLFLGASFKYWFSKPTPKALTPPISPEAFSVLRALLKLRIYEISTIYSTIREYQNRATEDDTENWIAIFMKEYSTESNDPWTEYSEKKEKKIKHRAMEKFKENYDFNSMAPVDLYRDKINDVKIALVFWAVGPSMIIKKLNGLKDLGVMDEQINSLIKLYRHLGSGITGFICRRFKFLFSNIPLKFLILPSYEEIQLAWDQVMNSLKIRLGLLKDLPGHGYSQKELNQVLAEIKALEDLEHSLDLVISSKLKRGIFPSKENEALLLENPISI